MRSLSFALSVFLMSLSTAAIAQHEGHAAPTVAPSAAPAPVSAAQKAYDLLKSHEGIWEGSVTTEPKQVVEELRAVDPELSDMQGKMRVTFGVASNGYALTHYFVGTGPHSNPLTVFYVDRDRLQLHHFCAFNNRPRMEAKISPDGKTISFDFLDVAGVEKYGHMHQAVFTYIDENHRTEDWVFLMPGDKPIRAHIDLHRVK